MRLGRRRFWVRYMTRDGIPRRADYATPELALKRAYEESKGNPAYVLHKKVVIAVVEACAHLKAGYVPYRR